MSSVKFVTGKRSRQRIVYNGLVGYVHPTARML